MTLAGAQNIRKFTGGSCLRGLRGQVPPKKQAKETNKSKYHQTQKYNRKHIKPLCRCVSNWGYKWSLKLET